MDITKKRKNTLINCIYFIGIIALYYVIIKYAFWTLAPFVIAVIIAISLQKPIRFIVNKTKLKKGFVGAVAVLLIVALLISVLVLVGYRIVVEFRGFGEFLVKRLSDIPSLIKSVEGWILQRISFLPDGLEKTARAAISELSDKLLLETASEETIINAGAASNFDISILATPLGGILSTAKQIPSILVAVLISLIASFFITCDYDKYVEIMYRMLSPEHAYKVKKTKNLLTDILGKMLKSYIMIMFITFSEMCIGLNILKVIGAYDGGYILAISIGTAVLDILPVFGTGAVMIPWIIYNIIIGKPSLAIGLFIVYTIITIVRQIMEPRLVAMNVGVPPLVTLAGMYIGLQTFGAIGIIIVPVTFVLIKALNSEGIIHLWGNQKEEKTPDAKVEKPKEKAPKAVASKK